MSCDKCKERDNALDERNQATKVWIQADTQTRQYCHKLEDQIKHLESRLAQAVEGLERIAELRKTFVQTGKTDYQLSIMAEDKAREVLGRVKK